MAAGARGARLLQVLPVSLLPRFLAAIAAGVAVLYRDGSVVSQHSHCLDFRQGLGGQQTLHRGVIAEVCRGPFVDGVRLVHHVVEHVG